MCVIPLFQRTEFDKENQICDLNWSDGSVSNKSCTVIDENFEGESSSADSSSSFFEDDISGIDVPVQNDCNCKFPQSYKRVRPKFSFLTKISCLGKKFDFWQKIRFEAKISLFDPKNSIFDQKLRSLTKISFLGKNFDLWQKIRF